MEIVRAKSILYIIALVPITFVYSHENDNNCFMLESLNKNFLDTWELYNDAKTFITNQALLSFSKTPRYLPLLPAEPNAHGIISNSTPISTVNGVIDITFELFDKNNSNKNIKYPELNLKELPTQGLGLWLNTVPYEDSHIDSGIFIIVNIDEKHNILSLFLKRFKSEGITEQLITGQYFLDKLFSNKKLKLNVVVKNKTIGINIRGTGTTLYKTLSIDHQWPDTEKYFYMGIHAENGESTHFPLSNSVFVTELRVDGAKCENFLQLENSGESTSVLSGASDKKKKLINDELLDIKKWLGTDRRESLEHLKQLFMDYEESLRHEYSEQYSKQISDLNEKLDYLVSIFRLINVNNVDNDILHIENVVNDSMDYMKDTIDAHRKIQNEKLVQIHEQLGKHSDKIVLKTLEQIKETQIDDSDYHTSKLVFLVLLLMVVAALSILLAIYFKIWKMEKRHIL